MIERVVSGGQTGVDRAALDIARELGLACGGWCPRGRKAEDGPLAAQYPLTETPSEDYAQRTEWNVRDADGTLILMRGPLEGGTAQTAQVAAQLDKPCLILDLRQLPPAAALAEWVHANGIAVMNVAGPRESKHPGIYAEAKTFLRQALAVARNQEQRFDGDARS